MKKLPKVEDRLLLALVRLVRLDENRYPSLVEIAEAAGMSASIPYPAFARLEVQGLIKSCWAGEEMYPGHGPARELTDAESARSTDGPRLRVYGPEGIGRQRAAELQAQVRTAGDRSTTFLPEPGGATALGF